MTRAARRAQKPLPGSPWAEAAREAREAAEAAPSLGRRAGFLSGAANPRVGLPAPVTSGRLSNSTRNFPARAGSHPAREASGSQAQTPERARPSGLESPPGACGGKPLPAPARTGRATAPHPPAEVHPGTREQGEGK